MIPSDSWCSMSEFCAMHLGSKINYLIWFAYQVEKRSCVWDEASSNEFSNEDGQVRCDGDHSVLQVLVQLTAILLDFHHLKVRMRKCNLFIYLTFESDNQTFESDNQTLRCIQGQACLYVSVLTEQGSNSLKILGIFSRFCNFQS